jgi:hypothetical protein
MASFQQTSWAGGINTSNPATEIADDEAQDILNLEFDWDNNLVARNGVVELDDFAYADPIDLVYDFELNSGSVGLVVVSGDQLYLESRDGLTRNNITGALTLPAGPQLWQAITFNGQCLLVNRSSSDDNFISIDSSGVATAVVASAGVLPKPDWIVEWNNRVWVNNITDPTVLYGSKLGDETDWDVTAGGASDAVSINIGPDDDGQPITGLRVYKNNLLVFKRRRVYIVRALEGQNPADATKLTSEPLVDNVGCASHYSIQSILDDLVFLSEGGVVSVKTAIQQGDFRANFISRKVADISRIAKISDEIPSMVLDDTSQYWLSVPQQLSVTGAAVDYVLDFSDLPKDMPRWTRFEGLVCGRSFTSFLSATNKYYIIAAKNTDDEWRLYRYVPRNANYPWSDAGVGYSKSITTKAYTSAGSQFGDVPLARKEYQKWAMGFRIITATVDLALSYRFDQKVARTGSYSQQFTVPAGNALWDFALWDAVDWDSGGQPQDEDWVRRFKESPALGKRAQSVTFILSNSTADQAFALKNLQVQLQPLDEIKVSEV